MHTLPDFLTMTVDGVYSVAAHQAKVSRHVMGIITLPFCGQRICVPTQSRALLTPEVMVAHPELLVDSARLVGIPALLLLQALVMNEAGIPVAPFHGMRWSDFLVERLRHLQPKWVVMVTVSQALNMNKSGVSLERLQAAVAAGGLVEIPESEELFVVAGANACRTYTRAATFRRTEQGMVFEKEMVGDSFAGQKMFGGPLDRVYRPSAS